MLVVSDDAKSSAAAAATAAAALAVREARIEKLEKALQEQQAAHAMELHRMRDEQYVPADVVIFGTLDAVFAALLCKNLPLKLKASSAICNPSAQLKSRLLLLTDSV